MRQKSVICALVFLLSSIILPLFARSVFATESSSVEAKLISAIKDIYSESEEIYIKFINLPGYLKEKAKVNNITFIRIPDATGDGVCSVEIEEKNGRDRAVQVAFKVTVRKRLFVLKEDMRKGDVIGTRDIMAKEMYLSSGAGYPGSPDDIIGKRLRKDLAAGTVLTSALLDDPLLVQRGDIVNIVAENKRLAIRAKGRTLDRGRMGDVIRVKNISSGKEIAGKLTDSSTVAVSF